jgi:hypothetical protein
MQSDQSTERTTNQERTIGRVLEIDDGTATRTLSDGVTADTHRLNRTISIEDLEESGLVGLGKEAADVDGSKDRSIVKRHGGAYVS